MIAVYLTLLFASPDSNYERLLNLPTWVREVTGMYEPEKVPAGAPGVTLLNEYLLGFDKEGYLLVRHRIAHVITDQAGAEAASIYQQGFSADVGVLKHMTGWHVPLEGPIQVVDQNNTVTMGGSNQGAINTHAIAATGFEFVAKGSFVAFESVTREKSFLGAVGFYPAISIFPTQMFRIFLIAEDANDNAAGKVRLVPVGFEGWGVKIDNFRNEIVAHNVPGFQNVALAPSYYDFYPFISAQFMTQPKDRERYQDWDHYARWYWGVFKAAGLSGPPPERGAVSREALERMSKPLRCQITYQQVYLSNARGFVPAKGAEVLKRAYGDCKDMAACFAHLGEAERIRVQPVLANIVDGAFTDQNSPPNSLFNHLIAAVPLTESLGLPAEVTVNGRRYLIFDATSADTAFGYLPAAYSGRSVLICSEHGADWVAIPASAIEPGSTTWTLSGQVDEHQRFRGRIALREEGNAQFFRTMIKNYGNNMISRALLALMPPTGSATLISSKVSEQGIAEAEWEVDWPRFLKPFGTGVHLPESIMEPLPSQVRLAGKAREMPLFVPAQARVTWQFDLGLAKPLKASTEKEDFTFNGWSYSWQMQGGARLRGSFSKSLEQRIYRRAQVGQGVKDWLEFCERFELLRREKALLLIQDPAPVGG